MKQYTEVNAFCLTAKGVGMGGCSFIQFLMLYDHPHYCLPDPPDGGYGIESSPASAPQIADCLLPERSAAPVVAYCLRFAALLKRVYRDLIPRKRFPGCIEVEEILGEQYVDVVKV